jgi:hypothetical protein
MSDARLAAWWAQTSEILALIANVNRDPKKSSTFTSSQFNPYAMKRAKRSAEKQTVTMSELRALIPDLPEMMSRGRESRAK